MTGKADTFADYSDLVAYIHARDVLGMTPHEALSEGDNGRGASGAVTAQLTHPMVALSPDLCAGHKHGDKVRVSMSFGPSVIATWEDNRPPSGEVNENTIVEFNPATCAALGLTPPGTFVGVTWEWA